MGREVAGGPLRESDVLHCGHGPALDLKRQERLPEECWRRMQELMLERMPERMPEKMLQKLQEPHLNCPRRMLERMLERMPEQMPEKMLQRL
jgi:hypothetical protein